ncbi:MAG: hypothetical protein O9301_14080 [Leptospira sp.]|nr:hypothetical protein [Leptospira sp.]
MPDFDRIDLMNYAMYGNDYDSEWDEIRAYLKSSASAQRELEEIKRSIPQPSSGKKRRDVQLTGESGRNLESNSPSADGPGGSSYTDPGKSWWKKILGE